MRSRCPQDVTALGAGSIRLPSEQLRHFIACGHRANDRGPVRSSRQRSFQGRLFPTQKLLPLMNDGGQIVNILSGQTRVAFPGSSAYAAAKGAVEVLTRYLTKELG